MKSKCVSRLSVLLTIVMLASVIIPALAAGQDASNPYVISDIPGNSTISVGKRQGVDVGTKGIISRDGKQIAEYEVTKAGWLYSTIAISGLAAGETVRVGDKAPITATPAPTPGKKVGKSSSWVWGLIAVGAIVALTHKSGHSTAAAAANSTVAVATQKANIPADGSSTTTITATITGTGGAPVADGTAVTFSSTAGTIVPAQATTTGGIATATLTAASSAGPATVTVTSGGKTGTVNVAFVAGGGTSGTITLAAGPSSIQVSGSGGTQAQSTITATCRDALDNLASGGTVTFTSNIGSVIGTATINANGVATTTFTSAAIGEATITASWSGVQATTQVDVTPGPPHSIVIECTPSAIQCDGNSFASVKATVLDIAGNPVTDGTVVTFSVQADVNGGGNGTITPEAQTTNGVANALLFSKTAAGATSKAGTATVVGQVLAANQPSGVPTPVADLNNHTTQVQFVSLDVAEIHIGASPLNIRGWDVVGNESKVAAIVYDTNHNPVPDGTAVYFTANHGMIYGNAGTAGKVTMSVTSSGKATATLVSDASGDGSWNGLVDVTATCGAVTLTQPGQVIFSGWPSPGRCSVDMQPLAIAGLSGQAVISVIALDVNGNPVVDGTKVTADTTKGNLDKTSNTTTGGVTAFTLKTSTDASAPTEAGPGVVTVTIDSGGPNPETGGQPVVIKVNFTVN